MRIVHFSDFHLRADHYDRAESIVKRLIEALRVINEEKRIDLVLFSGDMIDKAGMTFDPPQIAFAISEFQKMVIKSVTESLGLPLNRFIFTMGNHEVDRTKTTPDDDLKLTNELKSHEDVDKYMHNEGKNEPRILEYNSFRDDYWNTNKNDAELKLTPYQYGLKLDIDGKKVGINCLNTAWRCFENESPVIIDEHKIVMGKSQITDMRDFFEDCQLRFVMGHHHPSKMKEFEINTLNDLIARNYDAFFCGHTHDTDGEYVSRPQGSCFYFTSPGTLSTNESAVRQYRNGFMVVDYELDFRYVEAQCYYQNENADFVRDNNYGKNGIWHQAISGSTIIKPMSVSLFCQKREGEFLANDSIIDIIEKLRDSHNTTIQMVALSGLGKTRILREAFDDGISHPNYYYCEFSDNKIGLLYDVEDLINKHKGQEGLIVLDNCPNSLLEDVINKRDEYGSAFRIVGVNNDYYDRRNLNAKDVLPLFFTQDDTRQMVNEYIEKKIPEVNGDRTVKNSIIKIADGFPGMAIILVDEYLKENQIDVHTVDRVVKKMLKFDAGHEEEQEIVLRSLALFQPFPYQGDYREAYRFIREDEGITPLYEFSPERKRRLFNQTIGRYDNSLIEISESWLNVRPFPLAVWLVGRWFENGVDDECMDGIVQRIQGLDKPLYTVIRDGLYKRLEYMQDSVAAQELIGRLTEEGRGSFCNEKVVCSDLGSRLFLAMSSVNPGAIANCLLNVLVPKPIEWVKENVADDIRRNMVWALQKMCFCKESYQAAVKVLARLSVAENETWGNNASGLIRQLFHVMLPGTEASLQERIETLVYLKAQGNDYKGLTLDCIDRAFDNGHFVRDGAGSQFGIKRRTDYTPQSYLEIIDYWERCRDILIRWLNEDDSILERVSKLCVDHAFRWAFDGMLARMYPLLDIVATKKGWQWDEMYNALKRVLKERISIYPKDFQEVIEAFIQRIRPNLFCQKLKDTRTELYEKYNVEIREQLEMGMQLFRPLAKEFLDEGIYKSISEIKEIVTDKDYFDVWFSLALNEIITDEQLKQLLEIFRGLIKELGGDEFISGFVSRICYVFRERACLRVFLNHLCEDGYKNLYVRLLAHSETDTLDSYNTIKNDIHDGRIESSAADLYLATVSLNTKDQIKTIIQRFHADYPDRVVPLMDFISIHRFDKDILNDDESYAVIKDTILAYPINNDFPRSNYEYSEFVKDMLRLRHDVDFAGLLNKKMLEGLNQGYLHGNFDGIYSLLLTDYKDVIWDDFEKAFISDDHYGFLLQIRGEIGSGIGFAAGPLFQIEDDRVKEMCRKYPDKAPLRVAEMIPVFKDADHFSDWFIWLLDEYGNQKYVLDSLHANMGTYSWTGSVIPLLEKKKRCMKNISNHHRPEVRMWAEQCLKEIDDELKIERTREEYMRLHY